MAEVSDKVEAVRMEGEFRVCPACGYERGFHVSLVAPADASRVVLVLICPNCGARYDVGKQL